MINLSFNCAGVEDLRAEMSEAMIALYPGMTITLNDGKGNVTTLMRDAPAADKPAAAKPGPKPKPGAEAAAVAGTTATVVPPATAAPAVVEEDPLGDTEETVVTMDDVKPLMIELNNGMKTKDPAWKVSSLLEPFGLKKLADAKPEQMAGLLAATKAEMAKHGL